MTRTLKDLVSDILVAYQLQAQRRSIHLSLQSADNLIPVFADIALTERVFQNLLDNAFRFTPDGGSITIQVASELGKGTSFWFVLPVRR